MEKRESSGAHERSCEWAITNNNKGEAEVGKNGRIKIKKFFSVVLRVHVILIQANEIETDNCILTWWSLLWESFGCFVTLLVLGIKYRICAGF